MKALTYGTSIKGNGHFVTGVECQDANSYELKDNLDSFKVMAVADGHGGRLYVRSKIGATFACKIAKEVLHKFLERNQNNLDQLDAIDIYDSTDIKKDSTGDKLHQIEKLEAERNIINLERRDIEWAISFYDENYLPDNKNLELAKKQLSKEQFDLYLNYIDDNEKVIDYDNQLEVKQALINNEIEKLSDSVNPITKTILTAKPINKEKEQKKLKLQKLVEDDFKTVLSTIVERWHKAIEEHFKSNPISNSYFVINNPSDKDDVMKFNSFNTCSDDKITLLNFYPNKDTLKQDLNELMYNYRELYGCTLLAYAGYKTHNFMIQVGDGNITLVDYFNNKVDLFEDDNLEGEQTYSLCLDEVLDVAKQKYINAELKMAMLSTDGVEKALSGSTIFDVANDVNTLTTDEFNPQEDVLNFHKQFKPFLRYFSRYSYDDCTIQFVNYNVSDEFFNAFLNQEEIEEDTNDLTKHFVSRLSDTSLDKEAFPIDLAKDPMDDLSVIGKDILNEMYNESDLKVYLTLSSRIKAGVLNEKVKTLHKDLYPILTAKLNKFIKSHPIKLIKFVEYKLSLNQEVECKKSDVQYGLITKISGNNIEYDLIDKTRYENLMNIKEYLEYNDYFELARGYSIRFTNTTCQLINNKKERK